MFGDFYPKDLLYVPGGGVPLHASATALMALEDDPDQLLQRLNLALLNAKCPIARASA